MNEIKLIAHDKGIAPPLKYITYFKENFFLAKHLRIGRWLVFFLFFFSCDLAMQENWPFMLSINRDGYEYLREPVSHCMAEEQRAFKRIAVAAILKSFFFL